MTQPPYQPAIRRVTVTRPDDLYETADSHIAAGDRVAARAGLARAREIATDEPGTPFAMRRLAEAEARMGRAANRLVRRLVMSVGRARPEWGSARIRSSWCPFRMPIGADRSTFRVAVYAVRPDVRGRSSHMPL
jgi:hypothetical protein